jgi:hypothetical protein
LRPKEGKKIFALTITLGTIKKGKKVRKICKMITLVKKVVDKGRWCRLSQMGLPLPSSPIN